MRVVLSIVVMIVICCFTAIGEDDSLSIDVRVANDKYDGTEIWVGVVRTDENPSLNDVSWIRESVREFSVAVAADIEGSSLVFLKKNFQPVTVPLTADLVENGIELEFSPGISIFGSVSTGSESQINEGIVSLDRILDSDLVPPEPELLSWKLAEDGTFEIHGLQPDLEYVVTASTTEFMPDFKEVVFVADESRREMNFKLAPATYITGRIMDRYGTLVRGKLDTVVTPSESQTTEIFVEYDRDDHFRIGPFAEGVTVELTAFDGSEQRSESVEVVTPMKNVELEILRWVSLFGTVLNRETGKPVEEFHLVSIGDFQGLHPIDVIARHGHFEVEINEMLKGIAIIADGFLSWESGIHLELEGRESYDLGTVELEPSRTLRGRVLDKNSQLPVENARIYRIEIQEGILSPRVLYNVRTTTDSAGAFELNGFPSTNGQLEVVHRGFESVMVSVDDVETFLEIELVQEVGSISGRVVSSDGDLLYPAHVSIGFAGQKNEEDGSFSFDGITGTFQVSAITENGRSEVLEVEIENGEHLFDLELVINEDLFGRVHGTVVGLNDKERARIVVTNEEGSDVESNGTFELHGIPIGKHEIICRASSGRQLSKTIEMDETLDTQIDFVFEGTSSITGQVTIAGQPAAGIELRAIPEIENHARSQVTTTGDGTYVMEGLDEGDYTVVVTSRGVSRTVAVEGTMYVEIDLGSNELSGHIQASESVRGVHVYLTGYGSDGRFQLHTTVDDSGFYQFTGLAHGSYEVTVNHDRIEEQTRRVEIENSVQGIDFFIQPTKPTQKE